RQRGKDGAKGQVSEDTEGAEYRKQFLIQQPVKQSVPSSAFRVSPDTFCVSAWTMHQFFPPNFCCKASRAVSNLTPREAFINTTSPECNCFANRSAASAGVSTNSAFTPTL